MGIPDPLHAVQIGKQRVLTKRQHKLQIAADVYADTTQHPVTVDIGIVVGHATMDDAEGLLPRQPDALAGQHEFEFTAFLQGEHIGPGKAHRLRCRCGKRSRRPVGLASLRGRCPQTCQQQPEQ